VLSRWQGGLGALVVTLVACALVILDLADDGLRHWWAEHALTTGIVSGLLVLLITVLVADQVVKLRQINERSRVVAAQAAIVTSQAVRAAQAISQILTDAGNREAAGDEFRTYMMMLLVAAPVLIDAKTSRAFLEQAQSLGGEMVRALASVRSGGAGGYSPGRLDDAVRDLKAASSPLLQVLDPETRSAVRGDQAG
jgi:ABC-type phosphate transport system auxiliary subunit